METSIAKQTKNMKPEEVLELILDTKRAPTAALVANLKPFVNLRTLSLVGSYISNLEGFPEIPHIQQLHLNENRISGGLEHLAFGKKTLKRLDISNNRLKSIEDLKPLTEFKSLVVLDLEGNPLTSNKEYRKEVFELLPQLSGVDGVSKEGVEVEIVSDDDIEEEELPVQEYVNEDEDLPEEVAEQAEGGEVEAAAAAASSSEAVESEEQAGKSDEESEEEKESESTESKEPEDHSPKRRRLSEVDEPAAESK